MQDHPRVAQGGSNPAGWENFSTYSRAKYQEQEVKEQDRRAVEIDQTKRERRRSILPPPPHPSPPLAPRPSPLAAHPPLAGRWWSLAAPGPPSP